MRFEILSTFFLLFIYFYFCHGNFMVSEMLPNKGSLENKMLPTFRHFCKNAQILISKINRKIVNR